MDGWMVGLVASLKRKFTENMDFIDDWERSKLHLLIVHVHIFITSKYSVASSCSYAVTECTLFKSVLWSCTIWIVLFVCSPSFREKRAKNKKKQKSWNDTNKYMSMFVSNDEAWREEEEEEEKHNRNKNKNKGNFCDNYFLERLHACESGREVSTLDSIGSK